MKTTLLEHAIKHDTTEILKPIVQAAYSLTPIPSLELT